jgi:hypothetical protein
MKNKKTIQVFALICSILLSIISCEDHLIPPMIERKLEVTTEIPDSSSHIAIKCKGTVTSFGNESIIDRGFEWGNIDSSKSNYNTVYSNDTTNIFKAWINGLTPENTYYIRAFALSNTKYYYGEYKYITTCKDSTCFEDLDTIDHPVVYKPNIYIYPKSKIQLTVKIDFPLGGNVVKSIPEYGNGWNVTVSPNGEIDNKYTYLFYESEQPNIWQNESGWIIKKTDLQAFFETNLKSYGFSNQEIKDFTDYWIPRFNSYEYFTIYPQTNELIDKAISINYSVVPDKILRLFYVVKTSQDLPLVKLKQPIIKPFERTGYYITEWGVIL